MGYYVNVSYFTLWHSYILWNIQKERKESEVFPQKFMHFLHNSLAIPNLKFSGKVLRLLWLGSPTHFQIPSICFLVGLFVYVCSVHVWSCVRVLARLCVPVLVALLVAFTSRSTPVQWFCTHMDCACVNYIVLVWFFPADMRVSQESDWNTVESARVLSSVTLVVRVFGRTSVLRHSELRTDVHWVNRLSELLVHCWNDTSSSAVASQLCPPPLLPLPAPPLSSRVLLPSVSMLRLYVCVFHFFQLRTLCRVTLYSL